MIKNVRSKTLEPKLLLNMELHFFALKAKSN